MYSISMGGVNAVRESNADGEVSAVGGECGATSLEKTPKGGLLH